MQTLSDQHQCSLNSSWVALVPQFHGNKCANVFFLYCCTSGYCSNVLKTLVCVCAAFITLFTPFEYLSDMTSISSLFGFFVVALALLWRRYYGVAGRAKRANPWLPALLLAWLAASGVGELSKDINFRPSLLTTVTFIPLRDVSATSVPLKMSQEVSGMHLSVGCFCVSVAATI